MKKLALISLSIFILLVNVFAAETINLVKTSAPLYIEGFIDQYHLLRVEGLYSWDPNDVDTYVGMPFNLAWPSIEYKSIIGTGRLIGSWSLTSNYTPIVLKIEAAPLTCNDTRDKVYYYLDFHYKTLTFNPDTLAVTGSTEGDFRVASGTDWVSTGIAPFDVTGGIPVITIDQDIRFCLKENTDVDLIDPGFYEGNVTMTLDVK